MSSSPAGNFRRARTNPGWLVELRSCDGNYKPPGCTPNATSRLFRENTGGVHVRGRNGGLKRREAESALPRPSEKKHNAVSRSRGLRKGKKRKTSHRPPCIAPLLLCCRRALFKEGPDRAERRREHTRARSQGVVHGPIERARPRYSPMKPSQMMRPRMASFTTEDVVPQERHRAKHDEQKNWQIIDRPDKHKQLSTRLTHTWVLPAAVYHWDAPRLRFCLMSRQQARLHSTPPPPPVLGSTTSRHRRFLAYLE